MCTINLFCRSWAESSILPGGKEGREGREGRGGGRERREVVGRRGESGGEGEGGGPCCPVSRIACDIVHL